MKKMKIEKIMTKKILILTLSLLTINLVSKAQVELISSGTGSAYTLTVPGVFSLRNGIQVTFKAHANSSAAATINVSGSGALSIMKDGGTNALSASDIKAGQIVTLVFDGSNWQMMNPVATPPAAPTTYWSPNGSDIYNNNGGNVTVNADNSDGAYKMAIGKNASSVEKVLALTNTNNFVGGGTTFGFRSNFGGTLWDQALISGITGALSASGDLAFSVMQNRGTSTMIEAMRIKGNTGRIGIMTPNPDRTLHVLGDGLKIENAGTNLEIYPNGNEFMISTTKQYLSFAGNGGATAMYMDNGNIFVNLPLTIQDGSQAAGRVLASDASGNASWTDLSVLSSGSTAWTRSTPNIYPTTLTDNVGIGLSNPISKVQIHSISGAGNFRLTSAGTGLSATDGFSMSNDGTTEMFITQHENANWYFATNGGTIAMTILPSGKIGVGMTSPSAQLEVQNSTASATEKVGTFSLVNATGAGANVGLRGYATGSTLSNYGVNANAYGNSGTKYGVYSAATGTGTNYAGYFSASGGTTNYAIVVPSGGGNVGIGTSPSFPLDVRTSTEDRVGYFFNSTNTTNNTFGIYAGAHGTGSGEKRGGSFEAVNGTGTNIGVRGMASGGAVNWAGYFDVGNVFISENLGIGVSPSYKLHVEDNTTNNVALFTNTTTTGGVGIRGDVSLNNATSAATRTGVYGTAWYGTGVNRGGYFYGYGGTTAYGIYAQVGGGTVNYAGYFTGGDVYINGQLGVNNSTPTYAIDLQNNATVSLGSGRAYGWAIYSDKRLKDNLQDIPYGINTIMEMKPLMYMQHNSSIDSLGIHISKESQINIGFLAQDLFEIVPQVVSKPEDESKDFWSVDYSKLIPVLTKAIQEQQAQIEELKREIGILKNK